VLGLIWGLSLQMRAGVLAWCDAIDRQPSQRVCRRREVAGSCGGSEYETHHEPVRRVFANDGYRCQVRVSVDPLLAFQAYADQGPHVYQYWLGSPVPCLVQVRADSQEVGVGYVAVVVQEYFKPLIVVSDCVFARVMAGRGSGRRGGVWAA